MTFQGLFIEEEGEGLDDDGNEIIDSEGMKRRKVEPVKAGTFMVGVSGGNSITDQPRLSGVQHKVQDMCEWKR